MEYGKIYRLKVSEPTTGGNWEEFLTLSNPDHTTAEFIAESLGTKTVTYWYGWIGEDGRLYYE